MIDKYKTKILTRTLLQFYFLLVFPSYFWKCFYYKYFVDCADILNKNILINKTFYFEKNAYVKLNFYVIFLKFHI